MNRLILAVFGVTLLLPLGAAARAKPTESRRPVLYDLYSRGFAGFRPPDLALVKAQASRAVLAPSAATTWWRDALLVLVQKGPLVFLSRDAQVMAAPPFVVYVETTGGETWLYVYVMRELYRDAADPGSVLLEMDNTQAKTLADMAVQEIQAQMKASADTRAPR
jgi:hypothetical protein